MNDLGWQGFVNLCLETQDEKRLKQVLDLFLTPEERDSISKRYLLVKELLLKEKTQRQIAGDLEVSIAKITRGSNELKRIDSDFKKYLEKFCA